MSWKFQAKCLIVVFIMAFSVTAQAETPVIDWIRQIGTSDRYDICYDMSIDSSGNAYVVGTTRIDFDGNTNLGGDDAFLVKYDVDGNKLWSTQFGTSGAERGAGVSVDSSGNAYVTGFTHGHLDGNINAGAADVFLTKYTPNGTKLWTQQWGTTSHDYGTSVSIDGIGNAYVVGSTGGDLDGNFNVGIPDIFLTKYDINGVKQWTQQLGSASGDSAYSVSVDSGGNAYITGKTSGDLDGNTNVGEDDMFLVKYDSNGVKLWTKQPGWAYNDVGNDVSVDSSGNVYVTGKKDTTGINDGKDDMFLSKYDSNGGNLWTKQIDGTYVDSGTGVSVDSNGNVYVTGITYIDFDGHFCEGGGDMFLIKFDTDGDKLWSSLLGTPSDDYGADISIDGNDNVYVAGNTSGSFSDVSNSEGSGRVFVVKISTVPEPSTFLLVFAGLATLLAFRRR